MNLIKFDGGPLLGIDRASLPQWGGVLHSSFFGVDSTFENDYENMCDRLGKTSTDLSVVKGVSAEALLIDIPLPTFIVETNVTSIHLVQIWSQERGWSESDIDMDDFRSAAEWHGRVQFFCGGGEFIIFDSSCPSYEIEEHFSLFLERGTYRGEACRQKRKGQAEIVLIRVIKQD